MSKSSVLILAGVLLLGGCTGFSQSDTPAEQLENLRGAIADGTECSGLSTLFDEIDEESEVFNDAQGELINIGCSYRGAERTDADLAAAAPGSPWIGVPGEKVAPSDECTDSAKTASAETDVVKADPLIIATLDDCGSVDEWMSVVQLHPGMWGMMEGFIPQLWDLQSVCRTNMDTAVCSDAARLGLEVGP